MTAQNIPEGFRLYQAPDRFPEKIGPLYFKRDGDHYDFGFLVTRQHTNANKILHGGMMMAFADEMMGHKVFRAVGKKPCATISLNFDFVAAAREGDWVQMKSSITRQGLSVVFVRSELYVEDNIILTADGIWKIFGR
ncbi:PaaI family thioesterase [Sneathiella glossodoripedis]|uniref:PaaI family thioesterase n=1 Tax=Sneathiella glossodoripedis TaxID=418853 RepID=UPI000470F776|nr:PaaI family thioesterase [Sneathiella glossodoripedis]